MRVLAWGSRQASARLRPCVPPSPAKEHATGDRNARSNVRRSQKKRQKQRQKESEASPAKEHATGVQLVKMRPPTPPSRKTQGRRRLISEKDAWSSRPEHLGDRGRIREIAGDYCGRRTPALPAGAHQPWRHGAQPRPASQSSSPSHLGEHGRSWEVMRGHRR